MNESDLRKLRAAKNQMLFRAVNARLVELNETFEALTNRSLFVCECAHLDCVHEIELTLDDYMRVRADPRRFIVAAGDAHVLPDVEWVVERHETYFVVEKIGIGAEMVQAVA